MGLLTQGTAMSYEETKKLNWYIRKHGVLQFINLYRRNLNRQDSFKWGDEVEYTLIKLDDEVGQAQLLLQAKDLLPHLQEQTGKSKSDEMVAWHPEFNEYMLEGIPAKPYGHTTSDLQLVEENMKIRRNILKEHLKREKGETMLTITSLPRNGCPRYTFPEYHPKLTSGFLESLFIPDEALGIHPRFANFCRNIRGRLGEKPVINVPVFRDHNTPRPFREDLGQYGDDGTAQKKTLDDHVYFDTTALFGMCCLQITFQGSNIKEARHLYDHMSCITPIVLALSAATPILRGYLLDTDCRSDILSQTVDDRTKQELGLECTGKRVAKPRYTSISSYLSPSGARYNDMDLEIDETSYEVLMKAGVDKLMAQHVAHIFTKDSISMFAEHMNQDDELQSDLFDVQLTDFENAAIAVFVILLSRAILHFNLDFLIPISKADENWTRAQKRNAVLDQTFFFRRNIVSCAEDSVTHIAEMGEMTINEIMNGKEHEFPGLIPLVKQYLGSLEDLDVNTAKTICQYLSLLEKRANGTLKTTAKWMRDFVDAHPDYKHDSVVTERMNYDLMSECERISLGESRPADFLPPRYMLNTVPTECPFIIRN